MLTAENKTTQTISAVTKNAQGKVPFFQPKLTINEPGDEYEQEADRMAERVMRMPMNDQPFFSPKPITVSHVQRKCAHCEEEEKKMQRKENSSKQTKASSETSSYINSLSSKGFSLPDSARSFFEPRFGYDFSDVKIHNDNDAAKSAQSINAIAYTSGDNIVFNQNQFSPESDDGKSLLAHELTHVVQQNNKGGHKIQRFCEDKGVRVSSWVTAKNQHDFAALDGYSPIRGKIFNVFFDGKSYFFCFNDKRIYFKYVDNDYGVVTDFEKMYNIKVENGGDHWLQPELLLLAEALSMLSPAEISNLRGYRFIKEGGVRIDDGDKVTAGLTTQDIINNDYTIQFWKFCFDGSSDTEVTNSPGISKGVSCILHEIGHAMMFSRQRPLMEAMYFKDKYQKEYETASPEKQKAMKAKLEELIDAEDKAEKDNSRKPTVDAEFLKLTRGKKALTPYSRRNENEAFAEAFAIYKVNHELLKEKNLKLYEYFVRAGYQ